MSSPRHPGLTSRNCVDRCLQKGVVEWETREGEDDVLPDIINIEEGLDIRTQ